MQETSQKLCAAKSNISETSMHLLRRGMPVEEGPDSLIMVARNVNDFTHVCLCAHFPNTISGSPSAAIHSHRVEDLVKALQLANHASAERFSRSPCQAVAEGWLHGSLASTCIIELSPVNKVNCCVLCHLCSTLLTCKNNARNK